MKMMPTKGPKNVATFALESQLPKFPLPEIADTLNRYRRAALLFCQDEGDIAKLDQQLTLAVEELKPIQELLKKRREESDNYVHLEWWTKYAYLEDRSPITPIESKPLHFGWKDETVLGYQIPRHLRIALMIRNVVLFHGLLESEQLPVFGYSSEQPVSMNQFRSLLACCRIPKPDFDEQARFFHTLKERNRHERRFIVVGVRGRLYRVNVDNANLQPLSVGALEAAVRKLEVHAWEKRIEPTEFREVGFLTGSKRDLWAQARQELIQTDAKNSQILDQVERALFFVTLDESSPDSNQQALIDMSISPDGGSRWYDKSAQLVVFKNDKVGWSMEHSVMDVAGEMSMHEHCDRMFSDWIQQAFASTVGIEEFARREAKLDMQDAEFTWLQWGKVTDCTFDLLHQAKHEYLTRLPTVWKLRYARFNGLGRNFCKGLNVSPDSFCQMAFQDTYYRLHGRIPSTYESVGVLKFRMGRTETGRCASLESKRFVELSVNTPDGDSSKLKDVGMALRTACAYHEQWIRDASDGKGFDRHLFAVRCLCRENGLKVPTFLQDPLWARASKWDLSTSNAFLSGNLQVLIGGTTFRPVAADSLGIVYSIAADHMYFTVMSVDPKFDAQVFLDTLITRFGVLSRALVLSAPESRVMNKL